MQEMGWTWEELMNTPYERYLIEQRILTIEAKKKERENKKKRDQIESKT